ncbi:MAG: MBL fold metallo-hydrolase [Gammaproteobacteria bacterium]|jgi:glyoxylase-like metal-dependent hydrolase (beta-lactamase superfamily II)
MPASAPWTRKFLFVVGLLGISTALPVHARQPLLTEGSATAIAAGVYVVPDNDIPLVPNIGIIVGDQRVLVVDTGMGPTNAEIVLAEVRRLTDKPIAYLVCTHFHPEHNFGAQSFPAETTVIYSTAQHRDLTEKGEHYRSWFVEMFADDVATLLAPVVLRSPDITFERRAVLDLGGRSVELLHFGRAAHTRGDTLVFVPDAGILFAGGLTPNGKFPIMPDADSDGRGWIETLADIRRLNVTRIVPGHGALADASLIEGVDTYLRALRDRVAALHAAGTPLATIKSALTAEFVARHPAWTEPFWIGEAATNFYRAIERDE